MSARVSTGSALLSLLVLLTAPAVAASSVQNYTIDGEDSFHIAGRDLRTDITYTGTQRLAIDHHGQSTQFRATVSYDRHEAGNATHATGHFTSVIAANGDQHDDGAGDPDYLTILNQPFSVELDAPTMRDLHSLDHAVPFDVPSPITGAPLHGSLRRLPDGSLNGKRVLGIAFVAKGPLHGALPDRPDMALSGTITMNGTAYYAYADALLLALNATLEIEGTVANSGQNDPVTIVYKRTIRPQTP
jgi:hypothetical protein